ncbi:MAG TPA: Sir2 family NAD-dependent protein deacetylase [Bacteroidales bacterium]|nr:Sir2 family NAD-dependent protein deacetylase [Bacteroidales bacterium]
MQKLLVVFTGAGVSAESGLSTFRDSGGLWCNYNIYDVASPEGWAKDFKLVLNFYNQRRKNVIEATPNPAHYAIAKLESKYNVYVITQNIDDLHERAGSTKVIHLHGEIRKARSTINPNLKYEIKGYELNPGDLCELGSQLRPDVVWFGEEVSLIEEAYKITRLANCLIIIGTSLNVYPAANIIYVAPPNIPKYFIDPKASEIKNIYNLKIINKKASEGVPLLVEKILQEGI